MKLSVAIADTNAAEDAFVVWRGFEESIAKAKDFGYDGVELALRTREEIDARRLRSLLDRLDMEISCISTGQVFASLRQYLTNPDREARLEAVKTLSGLAALAGEFGGMVNLGRARGFVAPGQTRAEAEALFLDSLQRVGEAASRRGVAVVIEPVNRYEINFINTVDECAALLERARGGDFGIMPDVFHMNIEDAHIGQALEAHARRIRYVHLADSNRRAPGWGHTDFDEIFASLGRAGYDGWVGIEILPIPTPDEAALQAARFIRPHIDRHNEAARRRGESADSGRIS